MNKRYIVTIGRVLEHVILIDAEDDRDAQERALSEEDHMLGRLEKFMGDEGYVSPREVYIHVEEAE